jgi:hypothetical protein
VEYSNRQNVATTGENTQHILRESCRKFKKLREESHQVARSCAKNRTKLQKLHGKSQKPHEVARRIAPSCTKLRESSIEQRGDRVVKTPVMNRCFVIAKKIEVPTKKTKTAQKSTKEHKVGQNGTKRDKKTKTAQNLPKWFQLRISGHLRPFLKLFVEKSRQKVSFFGLTPEILSFVKRTSAKCLVPANILSSTQ